MVSRKKRRKQKKYVDLLCYPIITRWRPRVEIKDETKVFPINSYYLNVGQLDICYGLIPYQIKFSKHDLT